MALAPSPSPAGRGKRPKRISRRAAGFDFTSYMRRLCQDMTARVDRLGHIDMSRVAVSFSQARKATEHGMYASLTPMRFANGRTHTRRRGRKWGVQQLRDDAGREMLYILNFYLPRFLDLPFREKLTTVAHELWHISPKCDGDIRRFAGRCFAHGSSQKQYDTVVDVLVDRWLADDPPESVYGFLQLNLRSLIARHGRVYGRRVPTPKLIPVP